MFTQEICHVLSLTDKSDGVVVIAKSPESDYEGYEPKNVFHLQLDLESMWFIRCWLHFVQIQHYYSYWRQRRYNEMFVCGDKY